MFVIKKIDCPDGKYTGTITNIRERGKRAIIDAEVEIPEEGTVPLCKWYDAEPFWGSALNFLVEKMGLLDEDEKEIDLNTLIGRKVIVTVENRKGNLNMRYIEPSTDGVSGGDDIG